MVGALLAAAPVAGPAAWVGDCLTAACALGLAGCGLAFVLFPRRIAGSERRMLESSVFATAILAGLLSAMVAAAGPQLGAVGAGLPASLPVVSAPVAAMAHAAGARDDATEFLRGYIVGLPGRVAFGAAFAAAAVHLGAPTPFALAGLAVVFVNASVARVVLRFDAVIPLARRDVAAARRHPLREERAAAALPLPSGPSGGVLGKRRWAKSRC